MNVICWVSKPPSPEFSTHLWIVSACIVFVLWFFVPIFFGTNLRIDYLAIDPSFQNLAVILSISFGEEFTFRVLPIVLVFFFFPKRTANSILLGIVCSYFFGMWHEWELTQNTCLGLGGAVLTLVYLKFGGAYEKPFNGFIACGSIHCLCNFLIAVIANILTW